MVQGMIYGIGHSTQHQKSLVTNLKKHGIKVLVDVRSKPYSSYNIQFNREVLRGYLRDCNIEYEWYGKALGGFSNPSAEEFGEAIDNLIELSKRKKVCVMCSESNHEDCHRSGTIEPALRARGSKMAHISIGGFIDEAVNQASLADFL
jgi:uncharacterized protein (DUF488 family)